MRLLTRRRSTFLAGLVSLSASAGCALIADLSQFNGDKTVSSDGGAASGLDSSAGGEATGGDDTGANDTGADDTGANDAGANDTGTADQATSSTDGPGPDAADAVAPDDGPPVDAGLPNLGDSWCSVNVDSETLLCDDFDEGKADQFLTYASPETSEAWSINQAGGTNGINRADYAPGSAPFSLEVITACSNGAAGCQSAPSQDQFTANMSAPSGIILSFALKIEDFDVNAVDVSLVTLGNGNFGAGGWRLSLDYAGGISASSNNQFLEYFTFDGGASTNNKTVIGFPDFTNPCTPDGGLPEAGSTGDAGTCIGGWVNIQIMADFLGKSAVCAQSGGPCATITYDGQSAIVGGGSLISISPPSIPTTQVLLGANFIQSSAQAMHLQYDNVKVEALP